MTGPRLTAIALLCVLLMIAPPEWGRVREWFFDKGKWQRVVIAVAVSVVSVAVLAILFVPIVLEWMDYLEK